MLDFTTYYKQKTADEVIGVIDKLFGKLCVFWYSGRDRLADHDLTKLYKKQLGIKPTLKKQIFKGDIVRYRDQNQIQIQFAYIKEKFPNPVEWIEHKRHVHFRTFLCTTHGDMNGHNILVSNEGIPWLIDFATTGKGHILRDFVRLESVIQLALLKPANINDFYAFERALLTPTKFDEFLNMDLTTNNNDIDKAFNVIKQLRFRARDVIQPGDPDAAEYYMGLLYEILSRLRRHQDMYAFLSAAMICKRLDELLPA